MYPLPMSFQEAYGVRLMKLYVIWTMNINLKRNSRFCLQYLGIIKTLKNMYQNYDYEYQYQNEIDDEKLESSYNQCQKYKIAQNQHICLPTQAQFFDSKIYQSPTNRKNYSNKQNNQSESTQSMSLSQANLVLQLKQKLPTLFTDYTKNCMNIIKNVQFQCRSFKRQRKLQIKEQDVLGISIDSCYLNYNDQDQFNRFLYSDRTGFIRSIFSSVLIHMDQLYRNEIIYIFLQIIQKLQELTLTNNLNNLETTSSQTCSSLCNQILSSNKIHQLLFTQHADQQQSVEIQKLFILLLQKWLIIIYKICNNKIQELGIQYKALASVQDQNHDEEQQGKDFGIQFSFDFQADDWKQKEKFGAPRKRRFTLQ